jgi:hypothetical protein
VAYLAEPPQRGHVIDPVSATPVDLGSHGYTEREYFASGTARSHNFTAAPTNDGRWSVEQGSPSLYRTRIVVRQPSNPARFNGTVLVEWLNVSGGVESDAEWASLHDEILREGFGYVAVSAQQLGITGGSGILPIAGVSNGGLRSEETSRYGTLVHPGDAYSYDIFTQVARALETSGARLFGQAPRHVVAIGDSQSAFYLTTYVDAVQPLTHAFDGFLIHSRAGTPAPLHGNGLFASAQVDAARIRTDTDVPVFVFETETDLGPLLNYGPAQQPDTRHFRLWEVAGTAHADSYVVGAAARSILGCTRTINEGPSHFVEEAALYALGRWVNDGIAPPKAPRLALASLSPPVLERDSFGDAVGGVRTPAVDTPVETLSGDSPPGAKSVCLLSGSTTPFDRSTLLRLYGDDAGYLRAFTRSLDKAVAAGFILEADRGQLLSEAQRFSFPS